jgi:hypothetical protein
MAFDQREIQEQLSRQLDLSAPNLLSHFVDAEEDLTAFRKYITAFTTAHHAINAALTWEFLCRAIVSMIDGGSVPHRQFNASALRELDALRAAASTELLVDAQSELAAIEDMQEKIQRMFPEEVEETAPETPAQREARLDSEMINTFKNHYSTSFRDAVKRDPALRRRFERLSASGAL